MMRCNAGDGDTVMYNVMQSIMLIITLQNEKPIGVRSLVDYCIAYIVPNIRKLFNNYYLAKGAIPGYGNAVMVMCDDV